MVTHEVKTTYENGMSFTANISGHMLTMDSGSEGHPASGPSPKRLMLASLAGCTGMDVVSILKKMKVAFTDFSIDTKGNLTETEPKIYDDVSLIYNIRLAQADQVKMEKAVKLSQEKYCGVTAMFKQFARLHIEINYLPWNSASL